MRQKAVGKGGRGLLNRAIDSLKWELHLPNYFFCGPGTKLKERLARGDKPINKLDSFCRDHDIVYDRSSDSTVRSAADRVLADKSWALFKASDTPIGEKLASWIVTTAMNAKMKLGAGSRKRRQTKSVKKVKRKHKSGGSVRRLLKKKSRTTGGRNKKKLLTLTDLIRQARVAVRGSGVKTSHKTVLQPKQLRNMSAIALNAAKQRLKQNGNAYRRNKKERILPVPKSGGVLNLLGIYSGLSALGSLAGGVAGIVKAISETRDAKRKLQELQQSNQNMEAIPVSKGRGLYLKPYKQGLGLFMTPYEKKAKNF